MFFKKPAAIFVVMFLALIPVAALAVTLGSTPAQDSAARKAALQAQYNSMTPQHQADFRAQKAAEMKAKWDAMTPAQKEAVKARVKAKWDAMTPEQKAQVKARVEQSKMQGNPVVPLN
jgi:hypothetical protein